VTDDGAIYEGLVFGIGVGSFVVTIFAIISVIMCFFKDACALPNCWVLCAILLPVIAFLFFVIWPKESPEIEIEGEIEIPTDMYFVRSCLFLVLVLLVAVLAGIALCRVRCKRA